MQLHQQEILDIEKYGYSDYGIGFDRQSSFSFPGGGFEIVATPLYLGNI